MGYKMGMGYNTKTLTWRTSLMYKEAWRQFFKQTKNVFRTVSEHVSQKISQIYFNLDIFSIN